MFTERGRDMILTDYYRFKKIALKSKMRLDCVASTKSYPELEEKRATRTTKESSKFDATSVGDLVVYYGNVPDRYNGDVHRKADKAISVKGKNLSSVYVPDPESGFAYGDFKGTKDALLFCINIEAIDGKIQAGGTLEVFIARGKSKDRVPLYNVLCDGGLDEEMEALRQQAVTYSVTE